MSEHEHEDLGQPVEELHLLDEAPPERFVSRVRGSIQRRLFAGQVVDFGVRPLGRFFLEYVVMIVSLFSGQSGSDDGRNDER